MTSSSSSSLGIAKTSFTLRSLVRQFGIAHASMALRSLNRDFRYRNLIQLLVIGYWLLVIGYCKKILGSIAVGATSQGMRVYIKLFQSKIRGNGYSFSLNLILDEIASQEVPMRASKSPGSAFQACERSS